MKKNLLRLFIILPVFAGLLIAGCEKPDKNDGNDGDEKQTVVKPATPKRVHPNVDSLVRTASVVEEVSASSTITLTEGVTLTEMKITVPPSYSDTKSHPDNLYIVAIDLYKSALGLRVATPNNSVEVPLGQWPRATLTSMANDLDAEGSRVIAMVNGSFWNTSTITPRGPVHSNGTVMWSRFDPLGSGKQGVSYVGATRGSRVSIDYTAEYATTGSLYANLTGAGLMLVWDGKKVDNSNGPDKDREPRTALGYTSDYFFYFLCVDGRNPGVSEGMTMDDMGSIFEALKCSRAVNVDGGGSSQLLIRNPETGAFQIRNNPSDGAERPVIDGWTVIKKL